MDGSIRITSEQLHGLINVLRCGNDRELGETASRLQRMMDAQYYTQQLISQSKPQQPA